MRNLKPFGIILNDCLHIPHYIKTIEYEHYTYLLTWNTSVNVLSTYQIKKKSEQISEAFNDTFEKQNLTVPSSILDIICVKNTHLLFLVNGLYYQLEISVDPRLQNAPGEEATSSGDLNAFKLNTRGLFKECDKIIAVCPITDGFVLLVAKGECLFLQIYTLSEVFPRFVIPLQVQNGTSAVFTHCTTSHISLHLKKYFFPDFELLDEEFVLVGFSNGDVASFSVDNPMNKLQTLFCANQPIKLFHWITDPLGGRHTGLLIILSNGLVIAITNKADAINSHTFFLPGEVIAAACIADKLVTSDGINCLLNELCLQDTSIPNVKSSRIPVKGVQQICKVESMDDTLIVGTTHQSVYFINTSVPPVGNPNSFAMPDQSLLDGIMYNTQQLDKVNMEMDKEDLIMQAVSATSIANTVTNLFQIKVLVCPGEKLTVSIKLVEDAFTFTSELWRVHLELNRSNNKDVLITKLRHNLSHQTDAVIDMFCKLTSPAMLNCKLVAAMDDKLPWLIINIGKVHIDVCYLLVPVSVLQSGYSVLFDANKTQNEEDCEISIKLPNDIEINSFYGLLLKDIQHRISGETMKQFTDDKKRVLHMKLGNSVVVFNLDEAKHLIVLSCSNVELCYQIKDAIARRFSIQGNKLIHNNMILEIQALRQILETHRLNLSLDIKEISAIKSKVRSEISRSFVL